MEFKRHPYLTELECNEDGTVITWQGKKLEIKVYELKNRCKQKRVNFKGATHTVTKVVCEVWNGERDRMDQQVKRRDGDCENDHYTNLYWGNCGRIYDKKTAKRSSLSKITKADEVELKEMIASGMFTLKELAKKFNTSDMSIYRFKKRHDL